MVVIYLPFVILPIFLTLERIPRSLLRASTDLGAGGWDTFRRVVLPLSLPGTIAGALFAFVLALGDFVTPQDGRRDDRLHPRAGDLVAIRPRLHWPFGAAMAVLLMSVALLLIAGAGYAARRRRV